MEKPNAWMPFLLIIAIFIAGFVAGYLTMEAQVYACANTFNELLNTTKECLFGYNSTVQSYALCAEQLEKCRGG
jgi:hypothetical protein